MGFGFKAEIRVSDFETRDTGVAGRTDLGRSVRDPLESYVLSTFRLLIDLYREILETAEATSGSSSFLSLAAFSESIESPRSCLSIFIPLSNFRCCLISDGDMLISVTSGSFTSFFF